MEKLRPLLENKTVFGVDLIQCGLAELVVNYFLEELPGPGAVRATLEKYTRC